MKWITRERPKIDRIACPWLIKNFVDTEAEFIYVPKGEVFTQARELEAIPYDIPGAEYTHEAEYCTFDYIVKKHNLRTRHYSKWQLLFVVQTQTVFNLHHKQQDYGQYQQDFRTTIRMTMKCLA